MKKVSFFVACFRIGIISAFVASLILSLPAGLNAKTVLFDFPDSVKTKSEKMTEKEKIIYLCDWTYENKGPINHAFGLNTGKNYFKISREIGCVECEARALAVAAHFYYRASMAGGFQPDDSIWIYVDYAEEVLDKIDDKIIEMRLHNEIGSIYYSSWKNEKAIEHFSKALETAREFEMWKFASRIYGKVVRMYAIAGDCENAIYYAEQAIENGKKKESHRYEIARWVWGCYVNSGNPEKAVELLLAREKEYVAENDFAHRADIVARLSLAHAAAGDTLKSIEAENRFYELIKRFPNNTNTGKDCILLGDMHAQAGDLQAALKAYQKGHVIMMEVRPETFTVSTFHKLGEIYFKMGNYDKAIENLDQSLEMAARMGGIDFVYKISELLYKIYKERGEFEKALEYHEYFNEYRTKWNERKAKNELESEAQKYRVENAENKSKLLAEENENLKLKEQRSLLIFSLAVLLLAILVTILFYSRKRLALQRDRERILAENQKREFEMKALASEKQTAEARFKSLSARLGALRLQMNPHFIFNSVGAVQYLINDNRSEEAVRSLSKFAALMRSVMEQTRADSITIEEEENFLRSYLDLQKERMRDKFDFSIDFADDIDKTAVSIPPMVLQPFVENSIEHGIKHKESHGFISVTAEKNGDKIKFVVEDDGVGRAKAAEIKAKNPLKRKEAAVSLTLERMELLGEIWSEKPELEIIDLFDDNGSPAGTRVELTIAAKPEKTAVAQLENQGVTDE